MKPTLSPMLAGIAGILFLISCAAGGPAPVKGIIPQYTGLGEFENPNQGLNAIPFQRGASSSRSTAPVIKHAYAVDRGIYGAVLKIYIEAEDTNGEMAKIATTVDQVGYGRYPTDFIILKPQYKKYFKGYVQWNTFSSHAANMHEWVKIYATVTVIDKAGKASNEFVFPFTFETGVAPAPPPPAPFDQGSLPKLGPISIDLFDPFQTGDGGDRERDSR